MLVRTPAICLLLAAATFAAFSPTLSNAFVNFDDTFYIVENQNVNHGLSAQGVKVAFTRTVGANWHPLTMISHMIDCQLFGLDARRHHLVSLCIHVLAGVLLFLVMQRMTAQVWPSACVAGIFLLHPLHVESVAWASERKDVLSALFWIAGMGCWALYVQRRARGWLVATNIALLLALLSKPMAVTFPAVLLLLDYWPLRRNDATWRALVLEKVPMFLLVIVVSIVAYAAQRSTGAVTDLSRIPFGLRIQNA